jgi:DNA replication protein DnaC
MMPAAGSVSERIRANLEELGLDAMAAAPEYSSLVAAGAKSFPEALLEMTDAQVASFREQDLDRRLQKANFPYARTLRDFDFSFQPSINRAAVEDLAALGFLDRRENVVLVGSPGVGKAHIAVALGVEAVRARKPAYFVDCQRLVADPGRAAEKGTLERRLRLYSHLSLPVVDELGCPGVGKRGADLLSRLVSRRYGRGSTIVTTNVGMGAWANVFGDAVVASAIADRICHHCHVIRITGRSHGTKDLLPEERGGAESGGRD